MQRDHHSNNWKILYNILFYLPKNQHSSFTVVTPPPKKNHLEKDVMVTYTHILLQSSDLGYSGLWRWGYSLLMVMNIVDENR